MEHSLSPGQTSVLRAFYEFEKPLDDTGLAVYVHHIEDDPQSSSGIRSRRAELVRKGLVTAVGTKRLKSGRTAAIHALTPQGESIASSLFVKSVA